MCSAVWSRWRGGCCAGGCCRQFALELRDPVFLARPLTARRHACTNYFNSNRDLAILARDAVVSLNRAIGVPSPEGLGAAVNTPDQAR